jgi:hypothetical protein
MALHTTLGTDTAILATLGVAIFTALLAAATFYLAIETRATRTSAQRQTNRAIFRSAFQEIAQNLSDLHGWYPQLEPNPSEYWRHQRLSFAAVSDLFTHVAVHPRIWERAIAIVRNLRAAETSLKEDIVARDLELSKTYFYRIDLYLKQLARYIAAEMATNGIPHVEVEGLLKSHLLSPARWPYGDVELPPATIAHGMEVQPLSPFSALPPEPEESAYAQASLAQLIAESNAALAAP